MTTIQTKNWRNCIPLNQWMCLHDDNYEEKLTFKLSHYEIVNGAPKWAVETSTGTFHEASVGQMVVNKELSIRLFMPIELVKLRGHSICTPKLVFTLNSEWMISSLESIKYKQKSVDDRAREHIQRPINL